MIKRTKRNIKDIASPYCYAIGTTIASVREQKNMSQETLAYNSKVNRTHMTNIEKGRRSVGVDILHKIVRDGLQMEMSDFFKLASCCYDNMNLHEESSFHLVLSAVVN